MWSRKKTRATVGSGWAKLIGVASSLLATAASNRGGAHVARWRPGHHGLNERASAREHEGGAAPNEPSQAPTSRMPAPRLRLHERHWDHIAGYAAHWIPPLTRRTEQIAKRARAPRLAAIAVQRCYRARRAWYAGLDVDTDVTSIGHAALLRLYVLEYPRHMLLPWAAMAVRKCPSQSAAQRAALAPFEHLRAPPPPGGRQLKASDVVALMRTHLTRDQIAYVGW